MTSPTSLTSWDRIAVSAGNGELYLDPTGDRELLAACVTLKAETEAILGRLTRLTAVGTFGNLPSCQYFDKRFHDKIFTGRESISGQLTEIGQVAMKIHWTTNQAFKNYRNADQATLDRLRSAGQGM